jgi:hypothetical protein
MGYNPEKRFDTRYSGLGITNPLVIDAPFPTILHFPPPIILYLYTVIFFCG